MKKSLTELTEKQLLDIIGSESSNIKIYTWPNDIMDFISVYNIKSGQERITSKLLYKLYSLWSQDPIKRKTFTDTLMDLFPSTKDGLSTIILLNKNILNLKEEAYNYVKQHDKTKDKGWLEHFNKYLHVYCIKKGRLFIKDTVLYNLYDKWCYKKRKPLGFAQFNNFCKLYFDYKFIKKNNWFGVDRSINDHLTEDLINEMRKPNGSKKTYKKS